MNDGSSPESPQGGVGLAERPVTTTPDSTSTPPTAPSITEALGSALDTPAPTETPEPSPLSPAAPKPELSPGVIRIPVKGPEPATPGASIGIQPTAETAATPVKKPNIFMRALNAITGRS